jgi:hypothetical protein
MAVTFLTWLPAGLYTAPLVLLLLDRGLSLAAVAAIGAVYSVTVVALELPTLLTPAWMAVLAGGPGSGVLAYALVAAVGFAADAAGNALGVPLVRRLGRRGGPPARAACCPRWRWAGLAGSAALAGLPGVAAARTAYLLMFVGLGIAVAPLGQLLHDRVAAGERATVLSAQSLLLQLGGAGGSLALGWLAAARGPGLAFAVSGLLLGLAALTVSGLPRRRPVRARALLLRHAGPCVPARDRPREDRLPRS